MKKLIFIILLAPLSAFSEIEVSYESIVNELSRPQTTTGSIDTSPYSLDEVMIHLGAGYTNSFFAFDSKGGRTHASQKGVNVSLGIDLFSKHWAAEGFLNNYQEQTQGETLVGLKEFGLRTLYKTPIQNSALHMKFGVGLTARYLTLHEDNTKKEFTTPTSIFTVGLDTYLNKHFSFGADVGLRTALVSDTPDQSSLETTIKVDAHF